MQSADSHTSACICIEIFESAGSPTALPPTESMVQLIAANAEQAMRGLPAQTDSTFASRLKHSAFFNSRARVGMSASVIGQLLWLIPADFEVEVSGQLFPTNRRRVFAPDDGIVDVIGYVTEANRVVTSVDGNDAGSSRGLPVRYTIPSAGGDEHNSILRQIESASYIVNGALVCAATANAESIHGKQSRPGTAVTARIDCGRRSLGFVWFRELIEFWQRKRFSWSSF